ncbi:AGE family epimerase/isomerase [Lentibacillus salicampi]|uniref:AGE family epimerase/isomerase n=1 Tax=Lentibacillus salicampi TaxID=175306 RepID=A0A4Y9AHQ5_9BACI|nr:AGE family epimerase/isomerase [Lentibacillus salicampi]TFJ94617.1 AGE family epimerase/isomerase [Lentibacillus salicampi]
MKCGFPNFSSTYFLTQHILDTVNFYAPRCIDNVFGGYINCILDDGTICDYETKQLVGQARFVFIFSVASMLMPTQEYRKLAEHGISFLQNHQRDRKHGGYYWELKGQSVNNSAKKAYGHAFVLLAAAMASKAGTPSAVSIIDDTFDVLERYFWREKEGLYLDEISADWSEISPYRGQNANMHLCEAMITAYEATGNKRYLERAKRIAESVMFRLIPQSGGLIWEHYHEDWEIDWTYNYGMTKSELRPYGFILGHSIEWSKLLLLIERLDPSNWRGPMAKSLFQYAIRLGLDRKNGGIYFSMAPDGRIIDSDKYYWVMAEALGASALFAVYDRHELYLYNDLFAYSWTHFADQQRGGWYQLLNRFNHRYSNIKSPPPKTDYHPITNCLTALTSFYRL